MKRNCLMKMGSILSQQNLPRLTFVNKLPEKGGDDNENENHVNLKTDYKTEDRDELGLISEKTEPKILVSIVNKTTVIIAEGKSIATQTGDEENNRIETESVKPASVLDNDIDAPGVGIVQTNPETPVEFPGAENKDNYDEKHAPSMTEKMVAWDDREMFSGAETNNEETDIDVDMKGDGSKEENTPLPSSSAKVIVPEENLTNAPIPFEEIILCRYGKYKVRLSNDDEKCIISASTFLESGHAVSIDRSNQKIKFVDSKFQFISAFELPAKPWAMCARGTDVYVTMGNTKIQHLTVVDMVIEPGEVFEIKGRCLGICVFDDKLAVGLQVGELCLLNFKGQVQGTIQLPEIQPGKSCNPWHLCVSKENNFLVTDSDEGVVFCVDQNSELIFIYRGLSSPRGTAVDGQGNILVVGRDKESGVVASLLPRDMELRNMLHIEQSAVTQGRTLVTWKELEFVPYCVSIRASDNIVVLGGIQEALKIMELTSDSDEHHSDNGLCESY